EVFRHEVVEHDLTVGHDRTVRPPFAPGGAGEAGLLECEGEELLGGDVARRRQWRDRLDEATRPEVEKASGAEKGLVLGGEEQRVPGGPGTAPSTPKSLQECADRTGRVDLDHPVEVTDVDAELQR